MIISPDYLKVQQDYVINNEINSVVVRKQAS